MYDGETGCWDSRGVLKRFLGEGIRTESDAVDFLEKEFSRDARYTKGDPDELSFEDQS